MRYLRNTVKVLAWTVGFFVLLVVGVLLYLQHPKFGGVIKEGSQRAERIAQSVNYKDGVFHNLEPDPAPKKKQNTVDRLLNFYDIIFVRSKTTRPKVVVESVKSDLSSLDRDKDMLLWFGHATYFIQFEGKRILTDPVFEGAAPLSFLNTPFEGADIYNVEDIPELDYIVITHDHWDHLDYHSIKELKGRTEKFIVPLGVGAHLERWEVEPDRIIELDWYEGAKIDNDISITAMPARHYSGRLLDKNKMLWCGYMISSNDYNFYLSGDSGYGKHITDILEHYPDIDFAIIENGQYDMEWRHIHFVPEDLVRVVKELNPKSFVTSHNSKYAMARHEWDNPMNTIYDAATKDSLNLFYPKIGELFRYKESGCRGDKWW